MRNQLRESNAMQGRREKPHKAPSCFSRLPCNPSTFFRLPLNRPAEDGVTTPQAYRNFFSMRAWQAYRIMPSPRPVAGSRRFRFPLPEYPERGNCSPAPRRTSAIFPPAVEGKRKRVGRVREGRGKTVGALSGFPRPSCIAFNSIAFNSIALELTRLTQQHYRANSTNELPGRGSNS
jgi:hypothetical protein